MPSHGNVNRQQRNVWLRLPELLNIKKTHIPQGDFIILRTDPAMVQSTSIHKSFFTAVHNTKLLFSMIPVTQLIEAVVFTAWMMSQA